MPVVLKTRRRLLSRKRAVAYPTPCWFGGTSRLLPGSRLHPPAAARTNFPLHALMCGISIDHTKFRPHMTRKWHIPRRTFLKGLGTCISLPLLEAMVRPMSLLAETTGARRPLRMGFIYVPNGANMVDWTPSETGNEFELPSILEPLADVRSELQVLTGLAHQKAFANGDGAGDHARANATFLTGCQARKTAGADIRIGVSVDQVAATRVGSATR